MELVYLIFGFIGFLLSIVIAKWIFRIDTSKCAAGKDVKEAGRFE
jgi:hypothetical protein